MAAVILDFATAMSTGLDRRSHPPKGFWLALSEIEKAIMRGILLVEVLTAYPMMDTVFGAAQPGKK
jgi:hypothetical protein